MQGMYLKQRISLESQCEAQPKENVLAEVVQDGRPGPGGFSGELAAGVLILFHVSFHLGRKVLEVSLWPLKLCGTKDTGKGDWIPQGHWRSDRIWGGIPESGGRVRSWGRDRSGRHVPDAGCGQGLSPASCCCLRCARR